MSIAAINLDVSALLLEGTNHSAGKSHATMLSLSERMNFGHGPHTVNTPAARSVPKATVAPVRERAIDRSTLSCPGVKALTHERSDAATFNSNVMIGLFAAQ
jgi:hypothetical protein